MNFSPSSDVTLVLTSCNRFDLLRQTLASFDKFNTYPIKEAILVEDSGDDRVYDLIPEHWKPQCTVIVNNPKLGQIKSIDLAYQHVKTKYIFHCEDDWLFYRSGFIETSKSILESNDNILQVWLRDFNNDIRVNYPHHYPAEKYIINVNQVYYKVGCNHDDWKGFSFNPGLRRKSDYDNIKPYFCNKSSDGTESHLSKLYANRGMFAVFLEKSAVKHIGWEQHIESYEQKKIKRRNKIFKKLKYLFIGFLIGYGLHLLLAINYV